MRVLHSAWSWLNDKVAADSVAGNTFTGIVTRLTFRYPFQVGLAGIAPLSAPGVPLCRGAQSDYIRFGPAPEVQPGAAHVHLLALDPVLQEPAGLAIEVSGNVQPAGDAFEVRDEDQGDAPLLFPGNRRDLPPLHEPAVGPDAVFVEAAGDAD